MELAWRRGKRGVVARRQVIDHATVGAMTSRWYLRLTLWASALLILGLWAAGLEFTLFTAPLVGLAVVLTSTALARRRQWQHTKYGLSLAYLIAGFLFVERAIYVGLHGFVAVGLWIVLSVLGMFGLVLTREGRTRSVMLADRAASREQHLASLDDRRELAGRMGLGYEERSAALAEGFGRVEQVVPDNLMESVAGGSPIPVRQAMREGRDYERLQVLLEHAAGLEAESVIHAQVGAFPVTLFELELVILESMVEVEPQGFGKLDLAAEVSKRYLSVGMVTLPFPLPFVSSTYAYELDISSFLPRYVESDAAFRTRHGLDWDSEDLRRRRVALMTENEELARLLMSVPTISRSSLIPDALPPWFVDGDRLICSDLTPSGAPATAVQQWMSGLATLVEAFPWSDLDRFRTGSPVDQTTRNQRFFRTFRPGPQPGAVLERWEEQPTESGIRLLRQTHSVSWSKPPGA
jgi:hypothetical protein